MDSHRRDRGEGGWKGTKGGGKERMNRGADRRRKIGRDRRERKVLARMVW